ncbi:MAG: SurA N-terminal domain-containing protein [Alistipes sp.]|nr:SurA N-terminal domain-containing protein [Alistipes sp.]
MATLNTLRTKFGVVLTVIIALALLAFILSLKTEMGFSSNDPKVGVIAGEKISYSEYLNEYNAAERNFGGQVDERQLDIINNIAWQNIITNRVLTPGFDKAGIAVSDEERLDIIAGRYPSQVLYSAFADPATGEYDPAAVYEFLAQAADDASMSAIWAQINQSLRSERAMQKYAGLTRSGAYVNALEVASGVDAAGKTFSGKWTGARYSSVPDSLISISNNDLKKYYDTHKAQFKQLPNRTISYVVFDIDATADDMLALENEVRQTGADFAVAEDVKGFIRQNRYGSVSDRYISVKQLPEDEAEALAKGQYGPVLKNNVWTMSRVVDSKTAPDSLGIRHIVLPFTEEKLADSLLTALRKGGDFALAAAEYSVYPATAQNGGEVGVMPFSAFTGEFAEALGGASKGDIVKVVSGDAIQLMQVYRADAPVKYLQIATIAYPVEASAATRRDIHASASSFSVDAAGSVAKFDEAASAHSLTPRIATISQGERTIRGIDNSREVIRWAYGAKKGEISEIFNLGNTYVIAMVTDIDNEEYRPLQKVSAQVRNAVLRDKKYEYLTKKLAGSTIDEAAASLGSEVETFENVNYSLYYIDGIGFEPGVAGAIASTKTTGELSAPVRGMSGVYLFTVESVAAADNERTPEAEKVRAQAAAEAYAAQASIAAVQEMAKIEDLRGKYF